MNTLLVAWTLVGVTGYPSFIEKYDWRPIGEFATPAHCERAAAQLVLNPKQYRCVSTGKEK